MSKNQKIGMLFFVSLLVVSGLVAILFGWFSDASEQPARTLYGHVIYDKEYFGDGTGTATDPYIITKPEHLKSLAWLQYMGYFNQEDSSGNIKQVYFKLGNDIDMTGWTIPPIGTSEYPFVGNFNGNGKSITNLTVTNNSSPDVYVHTYKNANEETITLVHTPDKVKNVYKEVKDVNNIGLFGFLGEEYNSDSTHEPQYDEDKLAVWNLHIDGITIDIRTSTAIAGVAAGYVNGELKNVGVNNSKISNTSNASKIEGFSNLSDYFLVGYCSPTYTDYSAQNTTVDIYQPAYSEKEEKSSGQGTGGTAWGNTIGIDQFYDKITTLREKATALLTYKTRTLEIKFKRKQDQSIDTSQKITTYLTGTGGTALSEDSDNYHKNYTGSSTTGDLKAGSASFKGTGLSTEDKLTGTITNQYLTGYKKYAVAGSQFTITEEFLAQPTEQYIKYNGNYLSAKVENNQAKIFSSTEKKYIWNWESAYDQNSKALSIIINNKKYYLSKDSNNNLIMNESADYHWFKIENEIVYDDDSKVPYDYLQYNNGWKLYNRSTEDTFYINYNGTYMTCTSDSSGNISIGASTNKSDGAKWVVTAATNQTGKFWVWTRINNQTVYLVGKTTDSQRDIKTTTSLSNATAFYIAKAEQTPITNISELANMENIDIINGVYCIGYNNDGTGKWQMIETSTDSQTSERARRRTFVIKNPDGSYLKVNDNKNGFVKVDNELYATVWSAKTHSTDAIWYDAYTTIGGNNYYLDVDHNGTKYDLTIHRSSSISHSLTYYPLSNVLKYNGMYLCNSDTRWYFPLSGDSCSTIYEEHQRPLGYLSISSAPHPYVNQNTELTFEATDQIITRERTEEGYFEVPDTYLPIATEGENYTASNKNTGYFVSGANDGSGNISSTESTFRNYLVSSAGRLLTSYNKSAFQIATINKNSNETYVRIKDDDNKEGQGLIDATESIRLRDTYPNWIDYGEDGLDFQHYQNAKFNLLDMFDSSTSGSSVISSTMVYGLQFDTDPSNTVNINNLINVPKDQINLYDETITTNTYQMPRNCIDFNVKTSGSINLFAGTFESYEVKTTEGEKKESYNFFSLYEITRDSENDITNIRKIEEIYENSDQTQYKYRYSDTPPSESFEGYTLVFKMDWLENPNKYIHGSTDPLAIPRESLIAQACYYFEIPIGVGEYALGAAPKADTATSDYAHSAHLMYLDIGNSQATIINAETTEAIRETKTTYQAPMGVDFQSSYSDDISCSAYVSLNGGGTTQADCSSDNSTITIHDGNNAKSAQAENKNYYIRSGTQLINGSDTLNIDEANKRSSTQNLTKILSNKSGKKNDDGTISWGNETKTITKIAYDNTGAITSCTKKVGSDDVPIQNITDEDRSDTPLTNVALQYAFYKNAETSRSTKVVFDRANVDETSHLVTTGTYQITESSTESPFKLFIQKILSNFAGSKLNDATMTEGGSVDTK